MARPTVITPEVLDKLRQAFLVGATDEEACGFADIAVKTLYNYQTKDPEFLHKKQAWKNQPILKAKTTVVKALENTKDAQWYLERKVKKEFSQRSELTGADGERLPAPIFGGKSVDDIPEDDSNREDI